MGNAVTCSLVDVVGTVTVTQTDGQILEFVQPIFASQVKKLHPGSWLVHYESVHDPTLGHHSKMSMLQGNEELQAGEIYFLLPIPSHFRKQLFGSSKQRNSSKTGAEDAESCDQEMQLPFILDDSMARRQEQPTPITFSVASSPAASQQRSHRRCSSRHKIHVFDWRPTLMTIQEVF